MIYNVLKNPAADEDKVLLQVLVYIELTKLLLLLPLNNFCQINPQYIISKCYV